MSSLDIDQERAVQLRASRALIVAPAGSGKTSVLIERVRRLVGEGVPAERIGVLTFARKAAAELKHRLMQTGCAAVEARTFHAWAFAQLQRQHTLAVRLLRADEQRRLLRRILLALYTSADWRRGIRAITQELNWSVPYLAAEVIRVLETLKQFGWNYAAVRQRPEIRDWLPHAVLLELWRQYDRLLDRHGAVDFFRMIEQAQTIRYLPHYEHLLIDEVQDANPAELALIERIGGTRTALCWIGDIQQAIYAWRGAAGRAPAAAARVELRHNYRSGRAIIDLVNAYRRSIGVDQPIIATRSDQTVCPVLITHERYQEAQVLRQLQKELSQLGYHRRDVLVLARTHHHVDRVRAAGLAVRAMTVHAAKGLEAPVVIVLGCSPGRFGFPLSERVPEPSFLADLTGYNQPAEERRLLYVAMTRAQNRLILLSERANLSSLVRPIRRYLWCVNMPST